MPSVVSWWHVDLFWYFIIDKVAPVRVVGNVCGFPLLTPARCFFLTWMFSEPLEHFNFYSAQSGSGKCGFS